MNNSGYMDTSMNYLFGLVYGLIPLCGGLIGLKRSEAWGGSGSSMGKALRYLSLGLIAWACGGLVWAYYNFFGGVEVPYPSLADVAYIVSWPLWAAGVVCLSKATGAKFSLSKTKGKALLFAVPVIISLVSYYLLIVIARGGALDLTGGALKVFFDLAYPIGDIVILTLSVLIYGLSVDYLGGKFKRPAELIMLGFVLNYVSDMAFSWTTTMETFFVGNWVDLLFMTTMFVLSFGVVSLDPDVEDAADA